MTDTGDDASVTDPTCGRRFATARRVRLGDVSPGGRLRIDAVLRYLQDVGDDDTLDAGLDDAAGWVVRRTVLAVSQFPLYQEVLAIETWCSGLGGRWAERSTRLTGDRGGLIESATIWVHIDPPTLRALALPDSFARIYGPSAAGRTVSAKLFHDGVPLGLAPTEWPLRFADYDVMGHVNNAVVGELLEEQLARRRDLRAPLSATFEYRAEIVRMASVSTVVVDEQHGCRLWLMDGGRKPLVSAVCTTTAPTPRPRPASAPARARALMLQQNPEH